MPSEHAEQCGDTRPAAQSTALDFLLHRRSHPLRSLTLPAPDRTALGPILAAALRVPDHGKLQPWRLVVLGRAALDRAAETAARRGAEMGIEPERIAKQSTQFATSPLAVAVIHCPRPADRIPAWEQQLSTGALCLSLVNAALAAGWGANWLTGWATQDAGFCREILGLVEGETVAGLVHIGTATTIPADRPRPDPALVVTWLD